jgi:DNA-directed RNA polymerase sigma subunit (sigma70/sigma32)
MKYGEKKFKQRSVKAFLLRKKGLTYRAIGEIIGLSCERVRQIIAQESFIRINEINNK